MWIQYENNPQGKRTGDCVIRAIGKALGLDWEKVYLDLSVQGLMMSDWGNSNPVWDAYLRSKGYKRYVIPNKCPDCYTIRKFADEHKDGTYIVATGSHVVAVTDGGNYFDSWDSGNEVPIYFYKKG